MDVKRLAEYNRCGGHPGQRDQMWLMTDSAVAIFILVTLMLGLLAILT
jgi:hypothetical protein